jgi:hypothetical protein
MTQAARNYTARHLQFGWWSLLIFLFIGLALESMHGFKIGFYLDVSNETRRLLWTLAHAHGALLGLVHLGFALTCHLLPGNWANKPSALLMASTILLPGGFFLGGLGIIGGDPGPGIILVPIGALTLITAVFLIGLGSGKTTENS